MTKTFFAMLSGATMLIAAAPAAAQSAGDVNVSVAMSRTKLVDRGDIFTNGVQDPAAAYKTRNTFHGTVGVTYFPIDSFALEASISTPSTTNNIPAGSLAGTPNLGDDEFILATVGVRAQPFRGPISPYVGGGVQFQFTTQERDGLAVGLNIPNTKGPYVLGGVAYNLNSRLGIFAEARKAWYHTGASGLLPLNAQYTAFAAVTAKAVLDPLTLSVGATAKFGRSANEGGSKIEPDTSRWTIRGGVTNLSLADSVDLNVGGAPLAGAKLSTFEHQTLSVQIAYFVTKNIAVNATLGLPPRIPIYGGGTIGALPKLGDVTYGPTTFTVQYHPLRSGRVRPYIGAGASYMFVFSTKDGAFQKLKVNNDLGLAFEAGTDFMLTTKSSLFIDVKKALLRPTALGEFGGAPVVGKTRLDPWAFTGGVAFRF